MYRPSPREWLPEGHLAYFVLDRVSELDVRAIEDLIHSKDARGERPYSPLMMTALIVYAYCVGVVSSRKIERATHEDVAMRVGSLIRNGVFLGVSRTGQIIVAHGLTNDPVDALHFAERNIGFCESCGVDALIAISRTEALAGTFPPKTMDRAGDGISPLRATWPRKSPRRVGIVSLSHNLLKLFSRTRSMKVLPATAPA